MKIEPIEAAWLPSLVDLDGNEQAFDFEESFSRPNWNYIQQLVQQTVEPFDLQQAWTELGIQWLLQLRRDLGGDYHVYRSSNCILLTDLPETQVDPLLVFVENSLEYIQEQLQQATWQNYFGLHVVLLFSDTDDYFQYISYFYPDGTHPSSSGILISMEYVHIAAPYQDGLNIQHTLLHELVHNKVVHLPLPHWLNEGLAQTFERIRLGSMKPVMDWELKARHASF